MDKRRGVAFLIFCSALALPIAFAEPADAATAGVAAAGLDDEGQLGDGSTAAACAPPDTYAAAHCWRAALSTASSLPEATIASVSADRDQGFAVTSDGRAFAWGRDDTGQLGDGGGHPYVATPSPVSGLSGVTAISAGWYHALALISPGASGSVWAWGYDDVGELGDGITSTTPQTPKVVSHLPAGATSIAAGEAHSLAVVNGQVWGWGDDTSGELGPTVPVGPACGTSTGETWCTNPIRVTGLPSSDPVTEAAAGANFSLALTRSGAVWAWGAALVGQLGDPTITCGSGTSSFNDQCSRAKPGPVYGLGSVVAIAAGSDFALAARSDGSVVAWGSDYYGQLGTNPAESGTCQVDTDRQTVPCSRSPLLSVPSVSDVGCPTDSPAGCVPIAAGDGDGIAGHALALQRSGNVLGWGSDGWGELGPAPSGSPPLSTAGDGVAYRYEPQAVSGTDPVGGVAAGDGLTLLIQLPAPPVWHPPVGGKLPPPGPPPPVNANPPAGVPVAHAHPLLQLAPVANPAPVTNAAPASGAPAHQGAANHAATHLGVGGAGPNVSSAEQAGLAPVPRSILARGAQDPAVGAAGSDVSGPGLPSAHSMLSAPRPPLPRARADAGQPDVLLALACAGMLAAGGATVWRRRAEPAAAWGLAGSRGAAPALVHHLPPAQPPLSASRLQRR